MILNEISKLDKVLILGFAREGQSTYNFLRKKFPILQIDHADAKDDPGYLLNIEHWPLIIKSPGVSPHKPEIVAAKQAGVRFTSHMQIFFEVCPSKKIIGVTGTKGKSTTTSLIHHVLISNNIKCSLVGNIGKPALDYLDEITPQTWVVCELSSYQLMDLTVSPHIAILQNIYPDHLDYHKDFEEYKSAKLNITKYQTPVDYLITQLDIPTKAQKIIIKPVPVESQLLGIHNLYNIQPSIIIGELLGISKDKILSSIKTFQPLETRLELVAEKNGIKFYADTLATIPEATIAAIDTLHPATLIAGGHDRHQDYSDLAQKIIDSNIKTLILFPATGPRLWQEVQKHLEGGRMDSFQVAGMPEAIKLAFEHTPKNSICLLSPAAPSFTLFRDYRDEHDQYKKAVTDFLS
ncbi:MAG: hypothetical protein G01um101416_660 [Microgenomates group bacterium Gr01-1014_16]|nr:MAG: hypothetical protein G01um101416_660 [Microgenomates group bacterium Gr01-1014_16]